MSVVADVTRAADVERVVAAAIDTYGRIDILVNNVGIAIVGGPAELDEATWDRLMTVNIKSTYLTCHHAVSYTHLDVYKRQCSRSATCWR